MDLAKLSSYDRNLFIKERGNEIFWKISPSHILGGGGRTESKCIILDNGEKEKAV
jgi:hypothetical protein